MTRRDILSVGVVFMGFWSVLRGLSVTVSAITRAQYYLGLPEYSGANALWVWLSQLSYPGIYLAAGAVLLLWGEAISARLLREDKAIAFERMGQWEEPVFTLALRVIGVMFGLAWLPHVFSSVVLNVVESLSARGRGPEWGKAIGGVLVVAVSLYLMTGAKHLVGLVFRKRGPAVGSPGSTGP